MPVSLTTTKFKKQLGAKTKERKKRLSHGVGVAAVAASMSTSPLTAMKLELRAISSLKGLKRRARKSAPEQVERVARSLAALKQCAPILISDDGVIVDGHVVAQAMQKLGENQIWCVTVDHLDENQRELLHVTLNRLSECGEWDVEALGPLLIDLGEIGFDLGTTGFTIQELDIVMSPSPEALVTTAADEEIPAPPSDPVTVLGDLWVLGNHRLLCGDSTDEESFEAVLNGRLADLVFTDCPWNIPIEGFVSGLGKKIHKDFKMAAGEMSDAEFGEFCRQFHAHSTAHLVSGGVFYSCIDWRSVDTVMSAGKAAGLRHINIAVWNKGSGGMGTPYRSAHELVVVFTKGDKLAVNNVELGKHGRDRTNVWSYPGANRKGSSAGKALEHHPTPKPIEMVRDAILDVSLPGALVLDPFMGSGTTLLAAQHCGREACGIELDPAYVDVEVVRWEAMTGEHAIHAVTGLTFAETAAERNAAGQIA